MNSMVTFELLVTVKWLFTSWQRTFSLIFWHLSVSMCILYFSLSLMMWMWMLLYIICGNSFGETSLCNCKSIEVKAKLYFDFNKYFCKVWLGHARECCPWKSALIVTTVEGIIFSLFFFFTSVNFKQKSKKLNYVIDVPTFHKIWIVALLNINVPDSHTINKWMQNGEDNR